MAITLTHITDLAALGFDDIIDVRAPAEFAEDHLPGAINLPVLSDAERAHVGTIYKQVSPFSARKLGAALVAANAARHLQTDLADKPGGWRPLVYCWRGGQRSGSFASILSQIGWRVDTISGGYKSWRHLVSQALCAAPFPACMIVLDGNTGTAKTEVLNLLPARGVQILDLEGLANHRGSLFGAMGPQPSQKMFERDLAMAIAALDPARPVVVEAESSKVGNCRLPPEVWKAMGVARRLAIAAPVDARAKYLTRAYADMVADPSRLTAVIDRLRPAHAADLIDAWQAMASCGAFTDLAQGLMTHHYDPRYEKHRARAGPAGKTIFSASLNPGDLHDIAYQIAAVILSLPKANPRIGDAAFIP